MPLMNTAVRAYVEIKSNKGAIGMNNELLNVPENKIELPFVTVKYTEFQPETYKGIEITLTNGNVQTVNSGSFETDYAHVCMEYAPFQKSSTVDNFVSDSK